MFVWIKMLFFISNTSPSLIGEPGECCEDMVMVRHEHKVCCQSSGHISIHAAKKKDERQLCLYFVNGCVLYNPF